MSTTKDAVWNGTWHVSSSAADHVRPSGLGPPREDRGDFDLGDLPPGIRAPVAAILGASQPGLEASLRVRDHEGRICDVDVVHQADGVALVVVRGASEPPPTTPPPRRSIAGPGLWLLDRNGRSSWVNDRMIDLTGRSQEDLRQLPPIEIIDPRDRDRVSALLTGDPRGAEVSDVRLQRPDEAECWVIVAATPVGDDHGGHDGTFLVITDITDRHRREQATADAEERFRRSFAEAASGTVLIDADLRVIEANRAFGRVIGRSPADLVGTKVTDLVHPDDREDEGRLLANALAGGVDGYAVERRLVDPSGHAMWAALSLSVVRDADGTLLHAVYQVDDVTARRASDALTREAVATYQAAFTFAPVGLALVEVDGTIKEMNSALCRLLGLDPGLARNMNLAELAADDDRPTLEALVRDAAEGRNGMTRVEVSLRCADDSELLATVSVNPVPQAMGSGPLGSSRPPHLVVQIDDVTERKAVESHLVHQALHDPLTGLGNRLLLRERLESAVDRAGGTPFAVMYLDLDRFKQVNDVYGHEVGDQLLVAVADRLRQVIRVGDTVVRLGGDEFAVITPGVADTRTAEILADKIRIYLHSPFTIGGAEISMTASVGVVLASEQHVSSEQLLQDADLAMYRAKTEGRDRAELFDDEMRLAQIARHETERALRTALDTDGLRLYYQPIVDLHTGRSIGAEALLRVVDPVHGVLPPSRFLSSVDDSRMAVEIGGWVLEEACTQLARWELHGFAHLGLSVNVSRAELVAPSFADTVRRCMERHDVAPSRLGLEISESALREAPPAAIERLRSLAALGVGVGIDDFGTGSASISLVRELPLRFVKLDASVVRRVDDRDGAALAEAIVALARSLGLLAIASGVETERQVEVLAGLGCDAAQGHLFAPASPPDTTVLTGPHPPEARWP